MAVNRDFGDVFASMRAGVYIVTTALKRKPAGCTAVWVTRVSFDPQLLAVSLAPTRNTMQVIEQSRVLCVNVLGESGLQLARGFGFQSGALTDKFADLAFGWGASGSPIMAAAVSYFDCRVTDIVTAGDHRVVLSEVIDAAVVRSEAPLIYDPAAFYPTEQARPPLSDGRQAAG